MKNTQGCFLTILVTLFAITAKAQSVTKTQLEALEAGKGISRSSTASYQKEIAAGPFLFTENNGQVVDDRGNARPDLLFTARMGNSKVYLTANGIHYQFAKTEYPKGYEHNNKMTTDHEKQETLRKQIKHSTQRFVVSLANSNPHPTVRKEEQNSYYENFYLAHCPKGITNVHTYGRVILENIYPGIDWVIHGNTIQEGEALKYDFIVHPGADPDKIHLVINGADKASITKNGELLMESGLGQVKEHKPSSFCKSKAVDSRFIAKGKNTFGFYVGSYDRTQTLTIDPAVEWSTYYGGTGADFGSSCAVDGNGDVYMVGDVESKDFPVTTGAVQKSLSGTINTFITKFSNSGSLQWATYYGGELTDQARSCATDASGNVFMTGETFSKKFPTTSNAAQGSINTGYGSGANPFMVKLNTNGIVQWATYYGGSFNDMANGCATDGNGNVFMTGRCLSSDFPVTNGAAQSKMVGAGDAFMVKFNSSGAVQWSTYYGGYDLDQAYACATDNNGNVIMTGSTSSTNFPTTQGAAQSSYNGNLDAFIVKFSGSGNVLWSTYYGGEISDEGFGCATDKNNNIYVTGWTNSNYFHTTTGAAQRIYAGGEDAFVMKFNSNGAVQWSTYYGGSLSENGIGCAVDGNDDLYIAGITFSSDLPVTCGAIQSRLGGVGIESPFALKFNSSGAILWGSYYGGSNWDGATGCTADANGAFYMTGAARSTDFPVTSGAAQISNHSIGNTKSNAFLVKFRGLSQITTGALSPTFYCAGANITVPFTYCSSANIGNVYTVQLSDASGSFAAPINIGTFNSTSASGSINCMIPSNVVSGTGYRVRVVASNPMVIGTDNGSNITINTIGPPSTNISASSTTVCAGATVTFGAASTNGGTAPIYQWVVNNNNVGTNSSSYSYTPLMETT